MARASSNSSTSIKPPIEKFNFWTLFRKFRFKIIRHFFCSALKTVLSLSLFKIIAGIFRLEKKPDNYLNLLVKEEFQSTLGLRGVGISQGVFILIGLLLILMYALVYYWDNFWEEELRVRGGHYTKNLLLEKFRRLSFEEQQEQKNQINNLVEKDSGEVGYLWEHLPNHIFHSALDIILSVFFYWDDFRRMTIYQIFFSLFWLGLINVVVYFFTKTILNNGRKYKKELDKEWATVNKERNNIALIESMGLSSQYQEKQKNITDKNEQLALNYNRTKTLNETIPNNLLGTSFPFFLLTLSGQDFNGEVMGIFWRIFGNFGGIFQCLREYPDYLTSEERISKFLSLNERNDNLDQHKLPNNISIASIRMENISFRYNKNQEEWVLKNYNRIFTPEKINRLVGKNGTGKSTILYLLLGMITPEKGQIIIEDKKGEIYYLNKDINLKHWREKNIAYCSHDTLVEEGSTGQKQLTNIDSVILTKKTAQIFLFDEADNALDTENQEKIQEKIKKLVDKKIVIYIKH
ncbi:MAG: Vitamin B12 import ATP-binding protein BtuD [Mycoplasmataceae bacterium]|nr:MAG: Vitamin B12 import ATP-binding protein BtuD [Mycoplasmataceae bacterium]